jgi:hypothetical protein
VGHTLNQVNLHKKQHKHRGNFEQIKLVNPKTLSKHKQVNSTAKLIARPQE